MLWDSRAWSLGSSDRKLADGPPHGFACNGHMNYRELHLRLYKGRTARPLPCNTMALGW
ncbi:hypothetical protein TsFJ059_004645 [Trichoderma semiorbis]|uniref:Uncharacterized protein n=1 Tax=Trichoderma semiorbis TaxID=1491008 RepID=A0A9P8KQ68_9HYPO|nr:hypothetical protein TsFJ059_004645 [Trichoderma semiorbis]